MLAAQRRMFQEARQVGRVDLRVHLLEVGLDQIILNDLDEATLRTIGWDKVSLGLKRTVVNLLNKLDRIRRAKLDKVMVSFSVILGEACSGK
jgi:hypothetical protein